MKNDYGPDDFDAVMGAAEARGDAELAAWERLESRRTAHNTGSPKLPEYNAVESEFTRWWHKEGLGANNLSYRNLKQFYDIIVRQLRAGA